MIKLTKTNGTVFTVNAWIIEQVEEVPDTVITLTNGKKLFVKESMEEVTKQSLQFFHHIYNARDMGEK
nr:MULTISPECIES: flagellar FlbD family protein [Bacillus]